MITIRHLRYHYPHAAQPALHDVNLQVDTGEFVLLAGPSGAGKSTLLRCLNGLVPHFSGGQIAGQVIVAGHDVIAAGPQPLSRLVGFIFQNPEAQAVLDRVEPEIAFALENAAIPPAEMRLRVEEVLDLLELADLRERPLTTLSGGERQRVAIAAALALRPQILVLDEPTSQLDPQSAEEVLRAVIRLNEDLGLTVLLAEHRLERVVRYADRLIYMEEGRVVVDGPVRAALAAVPGRPPLAELAVRLGWSPLPLTVKEAGGFARRFAREAPVETSPPARQAANGIEGAAPVDSLLATEAIRFAYNGAPALNGVTLSVRPGEVVALMGRNGSGKSTLLKSVVGLLPAEGQVWLNGRSTRGREVADICREMAYLPQNPDDLLFADSVADELRITLRNHGRPVAETAVASLLDRLGLAGLAAAYPRDLSTGQRQRTALGAVTITAPDLFLFDEPTRGLDYQAKAELVQLWQQWCSEGRGILLVTHDVELAASVADRVIILSQGEVIADGPPEQVLNASSLFAPQMGRLFPERGWLTVAEALAGLAEAGPAPPAELNVGR